MNRPAGEEGHDSAKSNDKFQIDCARKSSKNSFFAKTEIDLIEERKR